MLSEDAPDVSVSKDGDSTANGASHCGQSDFGMSEFLICRHGFVRWKENVFAWVYMSFL